VEQAELEKTTDQAAQAADQNAQESTSAEAGTPSVSASGNSKARWYVVHVHSGSEKSTAEYIMEQAVVKEMDAFIEDVVVPTESAVEMRRGAKVNTERKFFPGYMLVRMEMNDDAWHFVKSAPKVTGFLGGKNRPSPISDTEVQQIMQQMEEGVGSVRNDVTYDVGEEVKVTDGPFASFNGIVEEADQERKRLKVSVSIFGRATPVELEYSQVERIT